MILSRRLLPSRRLLLSPMGRIGRAAFIVGVFVLLALYTAQHFIYPMLGNGLVGFIVPMVFFFTNMHIIFCIYGKRLHDLGRSFWLLIGMLTLMIVAAFTVGLKYGMLEYFENIHGLMNDLELQKDPAALRAAIKPIEDAYQLTLQSNMTKITAILASIPILFTLWLALMSGQAEDNRYGSYPQPQPQP